MKKNTLMRFIKNLEWLTNSALNEHKGKKFATYDNDNANSCGV